MSLAAKQDILSSASNLNIASLTLGTGATVQGALSISSNASVGGSLVVGGQNVMDAIAGTALDSSSNIEVASVTTASVKAPTASSLTIANNAGTGLTVASNGAIGILKTSPQEALDVYGNCAVSGTLSVGGGDLASTLAGKQDTLMASSNLQLNYLNAGSLDVKA